VETGGGNCLKVETVSNYPSPKDLKELNHFLGLTSYYRRFIEGYAKIAVPLHKLRQKGNNFCWNENCEKAFIELKSQLVNSPILSYPDFSLPFVVSTDASDSAVGAVLSQVKEGRKCVVAYWSRHLQKAERNYSTIEKEALNTAAKHISSMCMHTYVAHLERFLFDWLKLVYVTQLRVFFLCKKKVDAVLLLKPGTMHAVL